MLRTRICVCIFVDNITLRVHRNVHVHTDTRQPTHPTTHTHTTTHIPHTHTHTDSYILYYDNIYIYINIYYKKAF